MTYSVQKELPNTLQRMLQQIERESGLIGFVTLVGPQPILGGDNRVVT